MSLFRRVAAVLSALAVVAAVPAQPPADAGAGRGEVITVHAARMGANVALGGTVVPYKEVTLAAQMPGRVEYIAGREGDWFEGGAVLVAVNDDELLARRRQVLAELANAETGLRNAEVQYTRELWAPRSRSINRLPGMGVPSLFDQMFTRGMGSTLGFDNPAIERHADLYSSGAQVNEARGRVLRARSMLEELDAKLQDTRSVAPFAGVIVTRFAEQGDTVQPGQPLLRFADTQYLQVKVDVPARLMPGLRKGMILPARLDVGDTPVDVRVARIFPMADVQRHTVTVKFDLPIDAPGGPGMYAEVMVPDINAPVRSLPVVPASALMWRGSLPAVFVVTADGRTELRLVRTGGPVERDTVSVLSGLEAGERILARPPAGMVSDWRGERGAGR